MKQKSKGMISAVTYAKSRFSHDVAQLCRHQTTKILMRLHLDVIHADRYEHPFINKNDNKNNSFRRIT